MSLFDLSSIIHSESPPDLSSIIVPRNSPGGSRHDDIFPFTQNTKRDEIKQMIESAKRYVDEGNKIINDARSEASKAQNDAQKAINTYVELCKNVSQKLGEDVEPTIRRFKDFDIDSKIAPNIKSYSRPDIDISATINSVTSQLPTGPSLLDLFLDAYQYDKAKEQLESAKQYKQEALVCREEQRTICDRMHRIQVCLNDDSKEVEHLTEKVVSLSNQLRAAMEKNSFTKTQADSLKNISNMASAICNHISTEFLTDDASLSPEFEKQSKELKQINASIPDAPIIDDQRLLSVLREISKIPIET